MRGKMSLLIGFATGYVLGTRAGRERYEQLVDSARNLAGHPKVQQTADTLQHQASDAYSTARERVGERVGERFPGARKQPETTGPGTTGEEAPYGTGTTPGTGGLHEVP